MAEVLYKIKPLVFRRTLNNLWEAEGEATGVWYSFWKAHDGVMWAARMGDDLRVPSYFTQKQAREACQQHHRERIEQGLIRVT